MIRLEGAVLTSCRGIRDPGVFEFGANFDARPTSTMGKPSFQIAYSSIPLLFFLAQLVFQIATSDGIGIPQRLLGRRTGDALPLV